MSSQSEDLVVGWVRIPSTELSYEFSRSSGPGGQNVNKTSTKATLRWVPATSVALNEALRARFLERYASRITREDEILIRSDRTRDQAKNVDDCRGRLAGLIEAVLVPPKPRRPTRPSRAAKRRRLDDKRTVSQKKQRRGSVSKTDWDKS